LTVKGRKQMPPSQAAQHRRRRVVRIRRTVAVLAVSAFLALWAGLLVQLRTGHDPALGTASSSASSGTSSSGTSSSGASSSGASSSGTSSSGTSSSGADSGAAGSDTTTPSTSDSLPSATTSQS